MKAKVIIENGLSTIVLTPDNDFEKQVVENVYNNRETFNIVTDFEIKQNIYTSQMEFHTINIKLVNHLLNG
jgi:hypothetical protein